VETEIETCVRRVADIQEIANLQGRYMYYLEAHRYDDVLALFSRDAGVNVEIGEGGVYVGPAKVEALFRQVLRPFFTLPGMMPLHMLTTPVIEVDSAAGQGHGMWQTIGCNSFPEEGGLRAVWQQGTYDNLYIREEGAWRILRMRWIANFRTPFDRGWVEEPLYRLAPLDWSRFPEDARPDLPPSNAFESYDPTAVRQRAPQPPPPYLGG
jgi:hypothetical protein